ncbi:MAG: hypothetical protein ACLQKK_15305 [Rhodomicrobium sp.]
MVSGESAKQRRLMAAILREKKKRSRKEFGPGLNREQLTLEAVRSCNLPAHFAFAYERTGLLITADSERKATAEDLKRWHAALLEYFDTEREAKVRAVSRLLH